MKFISLAIAITSAVLMAACPPTSNFSTTLPKNTTATNVDRKRLGIREIKNDVWYFYGTQFNEEKWKDSKSGHIIKTIKYAEDGKAIEWEEDLYYSGKSFTNDEGTSEEFLDLHYEYGPDRLFVSYVGPDKSIESSVEDYVYIAPSSPERPPLPDKNQAEKLADDILKKWGKSRL